MSSCQQLHIQRPMSQAPHDPLTSSSTMVAGGHATEALNLNCPRFLLAGYFGGQLKVKDVS